MQSTKPNFIVIGAPKSGTTSLYHYLNAHPEVFMSPRKETDYFLFGDEKPSFQGPMAQVYNTSSIYCWEDYQALFNGAIAKKAIGESSPRYLFSHGVAERIAERIPDAKLIAILRNPIERAFSSYSMRVRDGWEPCNDMQSAIQDEARRIAENWASCIHIEPGYYAKHLRAYFEYFPKENIKIHLYDDLKNDPLGTLSDIFQFLEVSSDFRPDMNNRYNESGIISNPMWRLIWTRSHPLQNLIRPLLPRRVRQKISHFFITRPKNKIKMTESLHLELAAIYSDDIAELQDLIRRDVSHWLSIEPRA